VFVFVFVPPLEVHKDPPVKDIKEYRNLVRTLEQSGKDQLGTRPANQRFLETCWIAGNTQRAELHNKSKIRLLYR
jgi:hypothetical protein